MWLVGTDPVRLDSVAPEARERAGAAIVYGADVMSDEALRRLVWGLPELEEVDVLFHAAWVIELRSLESASLRGFDLQYRTNTLRHKP